MGGELVKSTPAAVSLCLVDKSHSLWSRQGVVLVVSPVDCASGSHLALWTLDPFRDLRFSDPYAARGGC